MHVMCKYRYTIDITVKHIYICKRATKPIPRMQVFRHNTSNRSITDQALSIYQKLEGRKWHYEQAVYQPLADFSVACDSSRESFLCNMKQVRLIKMCLDEICSKIISLNFRPTPFINSTNKVHNNFI